MHTPEAREKANKASAARFMEKKRLAAVIDDATNIHDGSAYYAKLAEGGVFRCPECSRISHKIRDFPTTTELGKHRRFAHGVLGRHHLKVQMAQERRHAKAKAAQANDRTPCPHCQKTFKNAHRLSVHISSAHQVDPYKPSTLVPTTVIPQELIHANGSTQGTVLNGQAGRGHSNDASHVTAIAVANLTGKLQSLILTASDEYDLPPRQLARRCILALSEHYST
jgi:hypothetical protein